MSSSSPGRPTPRPRSAASSPTSPTTTLSSPPSVRISPSGPTHGTSPTTPTLWPLTLRKPASQLASSLTRAVSPSLALARNGASGATSRLLASVSSLVLPSTTPTLTALSGSSLVVRAMVAAVWRVLRLREPGSPSTLRCSLSTLTLQSSLPRLSSKNVA